MQIRSVKCMWHFSICIYKYIYENFKQKLTFYRLLMELFFKYLHIFLSSKIVQKSSVHHHTNNATICK